ncbi:MAG: glycosyltransferase family 2 protein [Phycisphaerales bacterium]|nr:glycosyltransferase family 2 protein [Phycisphaerales bacterium]
MSIGIVIIGRNEAQRLAACLNAVRASHVNQAVEIVYVDSGSSDDSCEIAEGGGRSRVQVVRLDASLPFTAARARNSGAQTLMQSHPDLEYLQFLDGDTQMHADWLSHGVKYLEHHPSVGAACGRRRECNPAAGIYDFLADMEWNTPIGRAEEFGGDVLMRADLFRQLNGYRHDFIAGEEPELAARMRTAGYHPVRLNHEMTLHEMGMTRFSQWFRRAIRSGHAIAQLHHVHGRPPLRLYHQQWRSTWFWALMLPLAVILLSLRTTPWALLLYPAANLALMLRVSRDRLRRGDDRPAAIIYAFFTTLAKLPQLLGMLTFHLNRLRRRDSMIIEYKSNQSHVAIPQKGSPGWQSGAFLVESRDC